MIITIIPFPYLVCFAVQYIYPIYLTLNSVICPCNRNNSSTSELIQMLSYWIICSSICLAESILVVFTKIPFYYDAKLMILLWLILPTYSGAGYIFHKYIRSMYIQLVENTKKGLAGSYPHIKKFTDTYLASSKKY
ncbi:TB2/DP1, HVA22 family protein [Cryptosporidium serpentis]